jgi:hypothetical protein
LDVSLIGDVDEFGLRLQQKLMGPDGKSPIGRLYVEANTQGGDPSHVALNFTARGAPSSGTIAGALSFLTAQRDLIVRTFAEITSDDAHRIWGRRQ